jgi:DNA-binding transcriptional regulator YiaG
MKKCWKEDTNGPLGLSYLALKGAPMRRTKKGNIINLRPMVLERLIGRALISRRVPLRGKELKVLRAALGLSLEKFAQKLGLTSGAVFHWEKAENQRLSPINEAAVRCLCAEELEIDIPAKFSQLLGVGPEKIILELTKQKKRSIGHLP